VYRQSTVAVNWYVEVDFPDDDDDDDDVGNQNMSEFSLIL
jgi:hypothetical protein